jgi:hypothetical protein
MDEYASATSTTARRAGALLVTASAVTTAVVFTHPDVPSRIATVFEMIRAELPRWNVLHAFVLITAALWLVAGLFLGARLYAARPRAAVAGGAMTAVGSMALAGIGASEILLGKVAVGVGGAPGRGLAAQLDSGGAVLYLVPFVVMLTIGLAVLVGGLWWARLVPGAAAVAFVVGTVLSNPPIPHTINIAGQAVQLLAALVIARALTRGPTP